MKEFFADTYALIEFFKGNKHYKRLLLNNKFITTRLNLLELYYDTLKLGEKEKGEEYYDALLQNAVEISDKTFKNAAIKRYALKQTGKNISYIDAIGYQIANEMEIKFLTGDKEFKNLKNVEFIK